MGKYLLAMGFVLLIVDAFPKGIKCCCSFLTQINFTKLCIFSSFCFLKSRRCLFILRFLLLLLYCSLTCIYVLISHDKNSAFWKNCEQHFVEKLYRALCVYYR
jgi:hypothetical protein